MRRSLPHRTPNVPFAKDSFSILNQKIFTTIFDQSPISTQIFSPSGDTILVNKAWEKLWGISASEIKGYNVLKDKQLVDKEIMPYIKKGFSGHATEIPAIKYEPDKTLKSANAVLFRYVSAFIYPIFDNTNAISAVVLTHKDVTEQKIVEEQQEYLHHASEILASSLDYKKVLQKIAHLVVPYMADYTRIIVLGDDKTIKEIVVHHSKKEKAKLVKALYDLYKDRHGNTHGVNRLIQSGKAEIIPLIDERIYESVRDRPALVGIMRQLDLRSYMGVPIKVQKKVIGAITFSSDNPKRIYSNQDLQFAKELAQRIGLALDNARLYNELQNREQLYRLVVENSGDLIALIDLQSIILYNSPSVVKLLGYQPAEVIGKSVLEFVHKDDQKNVKYAIAKALSGKLVKIVFQVRHKQGYYLSFEAQGTAILDPKGKPTVIVATCHDITERLEQERRKDEFISMASHELKTPVTSLKIYTQILRQRAEKLAQPDFQTSLARMDGQITKLTNLISDLLDLSRIQTGKLNFRKAQFDVTALIQEVIESLQPGYITHQILLQGRIKKQIFGDRDRIGQVIINLISNAIKYSPKGNKVVVSLSENQSHATIHVQDFGIGIDKRSQKKIFERFYQIPDIGERTIPGLGIGLYISHEIIHRHRGKLWVESEKGQGSTFSFRIPLS